jgi:hypothetical protein
MIRYLEHAIRPGDRSYAYNISIEKYKETVWHIEAYIKE